MYEISMTQTIKDRLELLKRDQNAKKEDDPHFTGCGGCREQYPAICGCRDFNAGVDACLPLLEDVLREELEAIMRVDIGSIDATRVAVHQRLEALTDTK